MASSISISGSISGLPVGSVTASPTAISNSNTVASMSNTTLASGTNTISVPSGAVGCLIVPPSGNTIAITLKGVGADTGFRIHNTNPIMLSFDSSVTSFVLSAASVFGSPTTILFF